MSQGQQKTEIPRMTSEQVSHLHGSEIETRVANMIERDTKCSAHTARGLARTALYIILCDPPEMPPGSGPGWFA